MNAIELEKKLKEHHVTLTGAPRSSKPSYARQTVAQAVAQAKRLGFKGSVAQVYEKEAESGYISESNFENVTEQGLLDEVITPLTLGLVHGPGAGTTSHSENPTTGAQTTTGSSGIGEKTSTAANNITNNITEALGSFISAYGIRALEVIGGALLILFGLVTIAKGEIPGASVKL